MFARVLQSIDIDGIIEGKKEKKGVEMEIQLTEKEIVRFWSKVQKTDSCWEWKGHINWRGQGAWRIAGKGNFLVHHISYQFVYGDIPSFQRIRHRCSNRACVNPAHLYIEMPVMFGLTDTDIARFWAKVRKMDLCWEWTGTTQFGYGLFRMSEKNFAAHRLSYQLAYGEIPEGKMVCHRCNNSLCVNPAHLYAGTAQENVNDAVVCGHQIHGMSHHQHKLTDDQVREIRRLYADPKLTCKSIASLYGVSLHAIWRIVTRKNWRHI